MADHTDNEGCPKSLIPILEHGINLKTMPLPSIFTQRCPTVPLTKLDMRDFPSTSTGIYHQTSFPEMEVKSNKKAYRPPEKPLQIFEPKNERNKNTHQSKRTARPLEKPFQIQEGKNEKNRNSYHFKRIKDEEIPPKEQSIVTAENKTENMPKKKRPLFSLASPKTGDLLKERESISPIRFDNSYSERPAKKQSTSRFQPPTTQFLNDMIKIISPERNNSAFARYKPSNTGKQTFKMSNRGGRCYTTKKTTMASINFGSVPLKPKPSTSMDNNTKPSAEKTLHTNKDNLNKTILACSLKSQKRTESTPWADTIAFRRNTSEDGNNVQFTNETLHINKDRRKRTQLPCSLKFQKRTETASTADAIPFVGSTSQDINSKQSSNETRSSHKRIQLPCSIKCQNLTGRTTWAEAISIRASTSQDVSTEQTTNETLHINKKAQFPCSIKSQNLTGRTTWADAISFRVSTSQDVSTRQATEETLHINRNDLKRRSPSSLKSPNLTEGNTWANASNTIQDVNTKQITDETLHMNEDERILGSPSSSKSPKLTESKTWANLIPFMPGGLFTSTSPHINTDQSTDETLDINKDEDKTGSSSNSKSSKLTENTRWATALVEFILIFVKLISHPLRIPFRHNTSQEISTKQTSEETLRIAREGRKGGSPTKCEKRESLIESSSSSAKTEYFIKKEVLVQNFFVALDKHDEDIKNGVPPNPSHQAWQHHDIEILAQLTPIRVVTKEEAFIPHKVELTDIEPCSMCACSFIGRSVKKRFIVEALLEINLESKNRLPERKLFDLARALSTL